MNLPLDILVEILKESCIVDPLLCKFCFLTKGLKAKCIHYNTDDIKRISIFNLNKMWAKAITRILLGASKVGFGDKICQKKFNFSRATIHLIDSTQHEYEYDEYEIEQLLHFDEFDAIQDMRPSELIFRFPHLKGKLRHGDIIEDTGKSGYRANGVCMYSTNGGSEKITHLNRDCDDYGSPSIEFELFDFPAHYWDKPFKSNDLGLIHDLNLNFNAVGQDITCESTCRFTSNKMKSHFYWHADFGYAVMLQGSFKSAQKVEYDGATHYLVMRKGRKYLVHNDFKELCDKYRESYGYCSKFIDEHHAYLVDNEFM